MELDIESFELLGRILGELALISIVYGSICRLGFTRSYRQAAHGLLFGIAASVTMLAPITFADNVHIDGHLMLLAHAAAFGGPITLLIAAAISLSAKAIMHHEFVWAWLTSAAVAGGLGLSWHYFVRPRFKLTLPSLVALGLINSVQMVLFFLLPLDVALAMIARTLPVGLIAAVSGAVLMGKFIERELRHIDIEARLAREAQTDTLTGLENRRAFERALAGLDTSGKPVSAMVLDIDHFKNFNDSFGHLAGDAVLKAAGKTIADALDRRGTAYRTGGEEFTVLLPGSDQAAALLIAEEVRLAVAALEIAGVTRSVTISIGIAQVEPEAGGILAIRQADKALYLAKASGRNRSVGATALSPLEPVGDVRAAA